MEIIATLNSFEMIEDLKLNGADGILFGGPFSLRFNYSMVEVYKIASYAEKRGIKAYLSIDALISENDKALLYEYMEFVSELPLVGIYFSDLCVYEAALGYGLKDKMIYDGDTLLSNSLDAAFYLGMCPNGAVLAREITLEESMDILKRLPGKLDMQVFGHLKMSYSKRRFLNNYFTYLGRKEEIDRKDTLRIVEEKRDYALPIKEDGLGTRIYTDYILEMYEEIPQIEVLARRVIVDGTFVDPDLYLRVVKDCRITDEKCSSLLKKKLYTDYPEENFSSGYLYQKTNLTKDE